MSRQTTIEIVTMVGEAIHNPDEPRHFMRLKPINGRMRVILAGETAADSERAIRVLEVGRDFYDPVVYFPSDDVTAKLAVSDKTTKCPLKGETTYYHVVDSKGSIIAENVAWSYTTTFDFASALKDLVAFDPGRVVVEEAPQTINPG